MKTVVLGLGTNREIRLDHLREAIRALRAYDPSRLRISRVSPIYQSDAMLPDGAPDSWNIPYLNLCVLCQTRLAPEDLLAVIKSIESRLGRKERGRWAPREIDIDILMMESEVVTSPNLHVPHQGLLARPFALLPLADLAPDWRYPAPGESHGKTAWELTSRWRQNPACVPFNTKRTLLSLTELVGILNITPDSFSDGGSWLAPETALTHAHELVRDGARVLDLGAESTRPGAQAVDAETEWQRIRPVLERLQSERRSSEDFRPVISIDTRNPITARRALEAGADWINDVSGCEDPKMMELIAGSQATIAFMHHLGIPPSSDNVIPVDTDPVEFLHEWAEARITDFENRGISRSRLIFDPGIGFGKSPEQSLEILRRVERFRDLGVRVLIGHSRKSFISKLFGIQPATERDLETGVLSTALAAKGVDYLRVHDIALNRRALSVSAGVL